MSPNEYQRRAMELAIYPKSATLVYPTLGLVDETNELADALKSECVDRICKEAGDCSWYIAACAHDAGIKLSRLFVGLSFETLQDIHMNTQSLTEAVAEVAGLVKKMIRDDEGILTAKRRKCIRQSLAYALVALIEVCDNAGLEFETVVVANIEKLTSRANRNVLHGDGDNR